MPKILNNTPLIEGNVAYQEDIAIKEEENDIAPLVKSLRGILRPYEMTGEYDDELCSLILKKHS